MSSAIRFSLDQSKILLSGINGLVYMAVSFSSILFTVKVREEDGFHIDLDDYLMGILQLASELVCIGRLSSLSHIPN